MSTLATASPADTTLAIDQEIRVNASLEATFAALLEQLGPSFATDKGDSMHFKVEAFPGGRWFRDLGNNSGHLWGHVQSIKSPTLLEFTGPLMMSFGVSNNVQYRLSHEAGVTLIKFHHYAFGAIPEDFRKNMPEGWKMILERTRTQAEKGGKK